MTPEQFALLLTTARVLRARLMEQPYPEKDDIDAMNEALKPFDASGAEPINEASR